MSHFGLLYFISILLLMKTCFYQIKFIFNHFTTIFLNKKFEFFDSHFYLIYRLYAVFTFFRKNDNLCYIAFLHVPHLLLVKYIHVYNKQPQAFSANQHINKKHSHIGDAWFLKIFQSHDPLYTEIELRIILVKIYHWFLWSKNIRFPSHKNCILHPSILSQHFNGYHM